MQPQRTVINEARLTKHIGVANVRRHRDDTISVSKWQHLPRWSELHTYLSELTRKFYEERRSVMGREYTVSSVSRVHNVYDAGSRYVLLVKIKALSTTMKMSQVIGYESLEPLHQLSKTYELRFLVYIDLDLYMEKKTVTNLKLCLKDARCYYDCNCMAYHFQGMRYRAGKWALYPTKIRDPRMRRVHGANSKVCKHLGAISIDLYGFATQLHSYLKSIVD
jgi:hypothetical protein